MAYNNRRRSNGLSDAVGAIAAIAIIALVFGGIGLWIYTTIGIVMDGIDHLIAIVFNGPHLHWILLLAGALILAALGGWPYVLFGIWAAIFVANWSWWAGIALFLPALAIFVIVIAAPALIAGFFGLFKFILQVLGGRR